VSPHASTTPIKFGAVSHFDTDQFVHDCLVASKEPDATLALRELVERAVSSPHQLDQMFPVPLDPDEDGIIYRSPELTVTTAIFPKGFTTGIHNHLMAAVIGVWSGIEDNFLFSPQQHGVSPRGSQRVLAGDVIVLDALDIHDVHVPSASWSCALHVYLGDLIAAPRSAWTNEESSETPFDGEKLRAHWLEVARETGLTRVDA
jgi:predicted metal-dependent enzyme (double-stranded beta helix superfamily)